MVSTTNTDRRVLEGRPQQQLDEGGASSLPSCPRQPACTGTVPRTDRRSPGACRRLSRPRAASTRPRLLRPMRSRGPPRSAPGCRGDRRLAGIWPPASATPPRPGDRAAGPVKGPHAPARTCRCLRCPPPPGSACVRGVRAARRFDRRDRSRGPIRGVRRDASPGRDSVRSEPPVCAADSQGRLDGLGRKEAELRDDLRLARPVDALYLGLGERDIDGLGRERARASPAQRLLQLR